MTVKTTSEDQTRAFARALARGLKPGDVVCLTGPLGAGKTRFVQGLAAGLGCRESVISPTFTLVREYHGKRLRLFHLDLFRVTPAQLRMLGWEEYVGGDAGACAVEWAGIAGANLPADRLDVALTPLRDGSRRITLKATGPASRFLLKSVSP